MQDEDVDRAGLVHQTFDRATADELDYGNVIGIAFTKGSGHDRYRVGCPVGRGTAIALYERLGRLLYPNAWGPRCELCESGKDH